MEDDTRGVELCGECFCRQMSKHGWNYAGNVSADKCPNICSNPIYIIIHITPYFTGYKMQRRQYCCFSMEGAGESVSYNTSPEQDGERGGSGEGDTVPHMDKSERSCVAYCPFLSR